MPARLPHEPEPARPPAARRRSLARLAARWLLGLMGAACLTLFVGWLSLHWLILPHIDEWREPIERHASGMLGRPVKIGAITVRSAGWIPSLDLRDVRVLDAEQRVALSLPHVAASISPRSMLALEPRFGQLYIEAPTLDIRRDAAGHIRVAGLDFGAKDSAADDDGDAANWFFRQEEFVIRNGTIRWIDEQRQAPPLALAQVDVVVRNGLREHAMRIDATPPTGWGERFTLRGRFDQPLFARAGDWRRWSGAMFAELPRADVRELRRYVNLPFELSEGDGALRAWFEVKEGQPEAASVDLALRAVSLRLDKSVQPLEFEQVEGRFDARKKGDRVSVEARGFGFVTGDGIRWPKGDLSMAWVQPEGQDVTGGEFAADRLDVGVMAGIAGRVPLGAALRELLADVHPEGVITRLATRWDGPLDAPAHYRVKGTLTGLSLTPRAEARADAVGRPGLRNATVALDASEAGGEARIGIEKGTVELPGVFEEPVIPFDRLDAKLAWTIEPQPKGLPAISVRIKDARLANADTQGELSATWRTGPGEGVARGGRYPGALELDGKIGRARAVRTARYLPLGLPDSVRSYVTRAVQGGDIESASFHVRGDLWDFPFHDARTAKDGEFRIEAKVQDLAFAYIPNEPIDAHGVAPPPSPWPPLTGVSGQIVVDRTALAIKDAKAKIGGAEWSRIRGAIPQLGDHARLEIEGAARGPLAEMLRFVNATPVGRWTGRALANASGAGPAEMKLALSIPLDEGEQSRVKGSLALGGNDLRMTADTPLLGNARGRVDFTQAGFTVVGGAARVLGGELAFEGGTQGTAQRFTGQGIFTAEALRAAPELGLVSRLPVNGQAAYKVTLAFAGGPAQVGVTSNLVGMGIDLPAPLGKPPATSMAIHVQTGPEDPTAAGGPVRDVLQVDLGTALQARFVREGEGDAARVSRGAIRVVEAGAAGAEAAEPIRLPASGVAAQVVVKRLNVDDWQAASDRVNAEASAAPVAAPLVFDASGGAGYVPDTIALRVGELTAGSRHLNALSASLAQDDGLWRADVEATELAGHVEYRPPRRGAGAGRVFARLSRLSLPRGEAERVESLLDEQPTSVPALDVVVDDFELRGRRLGRLEIEASNRSVAGASAAREWRLSKFNLVMPEAQLTATGTWGSAAGAARNVPSRASMDFTLALADSGALLQRLGMGKVVRGGKGSLTGTVSWPGSPLSPDTARMSGQVKVAIESGQFLKASPGAARLLGVLSLQSLTRRLLFDFRDLFEEGFAFDNVTGDLGIENGIASTRNLRMRGAAAVVAMEGDADLDRETQNLRVVVVPEINAGGASLAYAVINPAVGLGTFLAQYLLRKPIAAASTREFKVTGSWDDPKVDRVERGFFGGALPADDAASAPAAPGEVASKVSR